MSLDDPYEGIPFEDRYDYMIGEYDVFVDELYREPLRHPLVLPVHREQNDFGLSRTCGSAEKRHALILTPNIPQYRKGTIFRVQGVPVGHVKTDNFERSFLSWVDSNDGQEDVLVKGGLYELGHSWLTLCRALENGWHVVDVEALGVSPRRPTRTYFGITRLIGAELERIQKNF